MTHIDKRVLNSFFRRTNSTPQDLLDWVNEIIELDYEFPCNEGHLYMGKYTISNFDYPSNKRIVRLTVDSQSLGGLSIWHRYYHTREKIFFETIKEFKKKYNLKG